MGIELTAADVVSSIFRHKVKEPIRPDFIRIESDAICDTLGIKRKGDVGKQSRIFFADGYLQRDTESNYTYDPSKISSELAGKFESYQYAYNLFDEAKLVHKEPDRLNNNISELQQIYDICKEKYEPDYKKVIEYCSKIREQILNSDYKWTEDELYKLLDGDNPVSSSARENWKDMKPYWADVSSNTVKSYLEQNVSVTPEIYQTLFKKFNQSKKAAHFNRLICTIFAGQLLFVPAKTELDKIKIEGLTDDKEFLKLGWIEKNISVFNYCMQNIVDEDKNKPFYISCFGWHLRDAIQQDEDLEGDKEFSVKNPKSFSLSKEFSSSFSRRYITSLLAKPFVILTGNSGTGKTRIAKQFAEYLGKNGQNYLLVPVGADWTDNTKILGFNNPIADNGSGKYVKTEIFKLIERANANPDIPFFLILDEMNLSHVERYFSDFLSRMETPDSAFQIDGYGSLPYPENLFVTGTVNIDETTYMFSPKVLDRANVIEFKPEQADVISLLKTSKDTVKIAEADDGTAEGFLELARKIKGKDYKFEKPELLDSAESILNSIYTILSPAGFEFAYRTVKEIRHYIAAACELDKNVKISDVMDEQILQKILPKIHGNKKELGTLLENLDKFCTEQVLALSLVKIKQMEDKLSKVQYASFI